MKSVPSILKAIQKVKKKNVTKVVNDNTFEYSMNKDLQNRNGNLVNPLETFKNQHRDSHNVPTYQKNLTLNETNQRRFSVDTASPHWFKDFRDSDKNTSAKVYVKRMDKRSSIPTDKHTAKLKIHEQSMKYIFDYFDKDHDQYLSADEMIDLIKSVFSHTSKQPINADTIKHLYNKISFSEFLSIMREADDNENDSQDLIQKNSTNRWMEKMISQRNKSEELRQVFDLIDKNHDGKISKKEFQSLLARIGFECLFTESDINYLFSQEDTMDFDQFCRLLK